MEFKDGIYPAARLRIAVTGKGGVGKTIVSAIMSKFFFNSGKKVLLVDADPSLGLTYLLGVETTKNVGDYRDRMLKQPALKKELDNIRIKDALIREALVELNGYSLLIMGKEESAGCYCQVNMLLKYGIGSIAKDYEIMLIDCEAGIEQINRRVINTVNTLFIITDTSSRGFKTAEKIKDLIETSKTINHCDRIGLIINRVKGKEQLYRKIAKGINLEISGIIPEDENISQLDLEGRPINDLSDNSPSVTAVHNILKSLKLVI
jgi:CO dehydrogenase maturation factor